MALLGCARGDDADAPRAEIVAARLLGDGAPVLEADLRLRFSRAMLDALDRGIPLVLEFRLRGTHANARLSERRALELRYLPLAQQYLLTDPASGAVRGFPRRTQLLAALDRVRLPLRPDWQALADGGELELRCALDTAALPGPLRLPALFAPQWRLAAPDYAWTAGG